MRPPFRTTPSGLFALTTVLFAICLAAKAAIAVPHGLHAQYFPGEEFTGQPAVAELDEEISTLRIAERWHGAQPPVFSARWLGYLTVWRSGTYTFSTTSDDGSSVAIDGTVVVDNGGVHGTTTRTGRKYLSRGAHPVRVEYMQLGGDYAMAWTWARENDSPTSVPAWILSPRQYGLVRIAGARALDVVATLLLVGAIVCGAVLAWRASAIQRYPRTAAFGLFAVMAVVHTWPLASNPAHLSRNDNGDALLNEWIIAWVAHQAPRAPLHLFDANIFYPEPDTLAYSENLIVQSAAAAPLLWLGATPVLAYNSVLLIGFALTGWAMCLVVARWTGSWAAGLVAGLVFGFNAHTLTRLAHLQAQHAEFLPLAVYALDGLLSDPTRRRAMRLSLCFTLQSLASLYLMVFTAVALVVAAIVRPDALTGGRARRVALLLLAAAGAAALMLLPFMLPYWRVSHQQGLSFSLDDAAWYSAKWHDYLATPARVHLRWWSQRFFEGTALFPGALGLALAAIAVGSGHALRDRRARMCLAIGTAGLALSFGPKLPGYAWLYQVMPLLQPVRATVRFGYLVIFSVAALAGFAVAALRQATAPRVWKPLAVALVSIAALEPLAAPLDLRRAVGVAPIYSHLPADAGAVVELPFYDIRMAHRHAPYMLNSIAHWRPMLNGYSGFQSNSYYDHVEALAGFPDHRSLETLKKLGVTHVFLHGRTPAPERLTAFPELSLVETFGSISLYRIGPVKNLTGG